MQAPRTNTGQRCVVLEVGLCSGGMQLGTIRYSARAAICVAALSLVACPSKDQPPPQPPPEPEPEVVEEVEEEEGPPAYAEAKWWDDFFTEFNAGEFDKVAIRFTPAPAARSVGMPVPEQDDRAARAHRRQRGVRARDHDGDPHRRRPRALRIREAGGLDLVVSVRVR